jgi:hypothetical protein
MDTLGVEAQDESKYRRARRASRDSRLLADVVFPVPWAAAVMAQALSASPAQRMCPEPSVLQFAI